MLKVDSMAPAQVYSFLSQSVFYATQLLKYNCFDCELSLEVIGDIGSTGEISEVVELKNAQHESHNPLSNRSLDLWKTLFNWTTFFYNNNEVSLTNFRLLLYINSDNDCKADVADDINMCCDYKAFDKLIIKIKTDLLNNSKYRRKKINSIISIYKDRKNTVDYYIESLLSIELMDIFKLVCVKFEYTKSSKSYYSQLVNSLKINYGCNDDQIIDQIAIQLIGWVDKRILNLLQNRLPVAMHTNEFGKFAKKYIGSHMIANKYIKHPSLEPSSEEIRNEIETMPKYLKQLELIELSALNGQSASYYLQLLSERRNWIKSGFLENVADSKYISFQKSLYKNWELNNIIEMMDKGSSVEKGRCVFFKVLDYNGSKFDNETLDSDLTKGFIHELANLESDNALSIGWHPDFKELLNDKIK